MLYSNYPDGFNPGAVIRDILGVDVIPGKVFYVGNNSTVLKGERSASDGNDGSFFKPLSTIDAAYNLCKANRNDIIFVRPAHTLSIADATTLVMDTAGVHIIGMGSGENRPVITFATATAAAIPITGANNTLANLVFKCNIASQNHMLDIAADDVKIINCDFREGTATGLTFITADTADGDSDRLLIKNCKFHMPTAGNGDAAITLAKDFTGVRIEDCDIYGDFDNASIEIPAGGNAQINLIIKNCSVTNLLTGVHAIEINGTSSTGKIIDCYCQGDTLGTIVDAGGLEMYRVYEHDGTDQQNARLIAAQSNELVDDANNILGVDDSNNVFASTNVAANRDGSIIERLEHLINPNGIGSYLYVTKNLTSSAIVGGGVDVTGVSSGGALEMVSMWARTDATGLAAGTLFTLEANNDAGKDVFFTEAVADLGASATETIALADAGSFLPIVESGKKIIAKCTVADCTGSGVITLDFVFRRLADTATIAAA